MSFTNSLPRSSSRNRSITYYFHNISDKIWIVSVSLLFFSALTLGGLPTRLGAIPILGVALWKLSGQILDNQKKWALWLLGFLAIQPVMQLVPFPPSVWTQFPGREIVVREFGSIGYALPWMPLSLSPDETIAAALIPIPAIAIFCAALTFGIRERSSLISTFLVVCLVSALVGVLQSSGPLMEILKFRSETSPSGFLRNRNHFAALLYCSIPFIAIRLESALNLPMDRRIQKIFMYAPLLGLIILAIGVSTSRSGMTLAILAIFASIILMIPMKSQGHSSRMAIWIIAIGGLSGVALTLHFDFLRLFTRLSLNPLEDGRVTMLKVGLVALKNSFPAGVGFGSFPQFYALHQSAYDAMPFYIDYLHNDIIQFMIEGGILALLAMMMFLLWYLYSINKTNSDEYDRPAAMAAAIAILFLMVHAFLEYHMRSIPVLSAFALFCALLTPGATQVRVGPGNKLGSDTRNTKC